MRTTIDIPDDLWSKAITLSGKRTKRETLTEALEEYVRKRELLHLIDRVAGSAPDRPSYDWAEDARLYEKRWARLEARRRGELD